MRKGIVQLVAIGVVIGVAVALVAVLFQWLPTSASEEFDRIQDIYWFATWMSVVIFALVAAVVVYSVWKWRVPPDDDAEGPPIHGHTGLEIVWTAVPAVLVIVLGIVSAIVLSENGQAKDNALQVKAIGQQFEGKGKRLAVGMILLFGAQQAVVDRKPEEAVDAGRLGVVFEIGCQRLAVLGFKFINDVLFHGGRTYHNKPDRASWEPPSGGRHGDHPISLRPSQARPGIDDRRQS